MVPWTPFFKMIHTPNQRRSHLGMVSTRARKTREHLQIRAAAKVTLQPTLNLMKLLWSWSWATGCLRPQSISMSLRICRMPLPATTIVPETSRWLNWPPRNKLALFSLAVPWDTTLLAKASYFKRCSNNGPPVARLVSGLQGLTRRIVSQIKSRTNLISWSSVRTSN